MCLIISTLRFKLVEDRIEGLMWQMSEYQYTPPIFYTF